MQMMNSLYKLHNEEVNAAFEILIEAIELEINNLNYLGSEAFKKRDYQDAKELAQRAEQFAAFRTKIVALSSEWHELRSSGRTLPPRLANATTRRRPVKLRKGMRTPESAYYRPLLQTLVELGGAGEMSQVLDKLYPKMAAVLKPVDHAPLPSGPKTGPRWRNTAQWARNTLKEHGFLKGDSPHGVWEITDAGRRWLEESQNNCASFLSAPTAEAAGHR